MSRLSVQQCVSSGHLSLSCSMLDITPFVLEEQLTALDNTGTTVKVSRACHDFCAGVWVGQSTKVASQPICYTEIQNTVTHTS